MTVILKRRDSWYRPLYYEDKQLGQIKIYDGKGNMFAVGRGWLEDSNYAFGCKDIARMEFESLPMKRKIPTELNQSFVAKSERWDGEMVWTLFLYAPDLKSSLRAEIEHFSPDTTTYWNDVEFNLNGKLIKVTVFDHSETNELGKKAEKLKEEIYEQAGVELKIYELARIMERYDIKLKKKNKGE